MSAICHSKLPKIIDQVMSLATLQSIGLGLQLIEELFLTMRAKSFIIKVSPKTRTTSIVVFSILIQLSHYGPHKHHGSRVDEQSDILCGKLVFVIDEAIDELGGDEEVQEEECVVHLKIQAAVAVVLAELQAIGSRAQDVQVLHWQEQNERSYDSYESEGRGSTLCDVISYSYYLCNYFDRLDGQNYQQSLSDDSTRILAFCGIEDPALKPQDHYFLDLPAQENDKEMRVHLRPSLTPQQYSKHQDHNSSQANIEQNKIGERVRVKGGLKLHFLQHNDYLSVGPIGHLAQIMLSLPFKMQTNAILSVDSCIMMWHLLTKIDVDIHPAGQSCQILAIEGCFFDQTQSE